MYYREYWDAPPPPVVFLITYKLKVQVINAFESRGGYLWVFCVHGEKRHLFWSMIFCLKICGLSHKGVLSEIPMFIHHKTSVLKTHCCKNMCQCFSVFVGILRILWISERKTNNVMLCLFSLHIHRDIRDIVASVKTIADFKDATAKLKERCKVS